MPVTRGSSASEGYNDLEIQLVSVKLSLESDYGSPGILHEQYWMNEPLGGIQRGEVAELVAIKGNVTAFEQSIGGNTRPGSCEFLWELTMDPEFNGGEGASVDNDIDGVTGAKTADGSHVEPDILDKQHLGVSNEFDSTDTTNGVGTGGGGTTSLVSSLDVNYRDLLGGGPVLDRHDRLYQHADVELLGDANSEYHLDTRAVFFWDVQEDE